MFVLLFLFLFWVVDDGVQGKKEEYHTGGRIYAVWKFCCVILRWFDGPDCCNIQGKKLLHILETNQCIGLSIWVVAS